MYQFSFQLAEDIPLDSHVVLPTDDRFDDCLREWKTATYFGFDIETWASNGSSLDPWRGDIRLVSVGLPSKRAIVVDFGGITGQDKHAGIGSRRDEFLAILKERLENPKTQVVGANLKFDFLWVLKHWGIKARNPRDVMLMSQVYWAGLNHYRHNLKAIAERLEISVDKTEQTSDFGGELSNAQLNYSANDSIVVLEIWQKLGKLLHKEKLSGSVMAEMSALPGFVQMEYHGMPADGEKIKTILNQYQEAAKTFLSTWEAEFPGINPDSSKQVVSAIAEKYKIFVDGTSQSDLAPHYDKPAIKALSLLRTMGTYIDYLKGCESAYFDGAIRGCYRQSAPKGFGRSTCGENTKRNPDQFPNVNLQNPPNPLMMPPEIKALGLPPIRSLFVVPDDKALIISDLSSAHARIACEVSQDEALKSVYNDGADMHCLTASKLAKLQGLSWTPSDVAKIRGDKSHPQQSLAAKLRQAAKPTFYGCVPLDAEALTREGWKTYDQLREGMDVLAYNPESDRNEWTPILKLHYYDDAPIVKMAAARGHRNGASWIVRCTENHRWFGTRTRHRTDYTGGVKRGYRVDNPEFFTTAEVVKGCRIFVAAPSDGGNGVSGIPLPTNKDAFDWVSYVLEMTPEQREAFLVGVLVSEGHIVKGETGKPLNWCFCQNPGNLCDAMKLAAYLQGTRISVHTDKGLSKDRYSTHRIRLFTTNVVTGQKMVITPDGNEPVWCMTTAFGTWVMRQGETITITGNSLNCQGAATLASTAKTDAGIDMTIDEAKGAIQAWKEAYAGLAEFMQKTVNKANRKSINFPGSQYEYGENRGLSGRRIFMPKMKSDFKPDAPPSVKASDCCAFVWTSTEADIIKLAIGRCISEFDKHPEWEAHISNCAHDELDVVCSREHALEVSKCVNLSMSAAMRVFIRSIPVDEGEDPKKSICKSWSEK